MSNDQSKLNRRDALKVIAVAPAVPAALAADHAHHEARQAAAPQTPKFFTAAQLAAVTALTDVIIPADDRSPGAREAGVASFIDLMLSESPDEVQAQWREGLAALDARSQADNAKIFADATREQQTALLVALSKNERRPQTPLERFFRSAKNLTIDGYYTSEIGIHKELRYKGNAYLKEFKGCTHPEHQS